MIVKMPNMLKILAGAGHVVRFVSDQRRRDAQRRRTKLDLEGVADTDH